jgi:hypothetical protein
VVFWIYDLGIYDLRLEASFAEATAAKGDSEACKFLSGKRMKWVSIY